MREAKEMDKSVRRQADRIGVPLPPYDFLELIGKGAYGKVFKRYFIRCHSMLIAMHLHTASFSISIHVQHHARSKVV